jgi:hypothetical protein
MDSSNHRLNLVIASPCPVDWNSMVGDDRVRFCRNCQQHVFHVSSMQPEEIESLVEKMEGRLCVRYFRRADGGVMMRDCPEAGKQIRRRSAALGLGLGFAMLLGLINWLAAISNSSSESRGWRGFREQEPFRTIMEWFAPTPAPVFMGKLCWSPPDGSADTPQPGTASSGSSPDRN